MKIDQVAIQLFTLREHCKTAPDLAATLKKVAAIGYKSVQVSGVGPIPPEEIRRIASDAGLSICATHEPGKKICESPQEVIDRLGALGCTATAYPAPHMPFGNIDDVKSLAAQLDRAGEALRRAGIVLCYHNHAHEFRRVAGKTVLQWIYELTDARNLQGEPDTYWVQTGGESPEEWCSRLNNRLPLLHLKDYSINTENKPTICEVGNGNLNWPAICRAADKSGCRWFIVEQDVCSGDPFDSIRQSFDYLNRCIAEH